MKNRFMQVLIIFTFVILYASCKKQNKDSLLRYQKAYENMIYSNVSENEESQFRYKRIREKYNFTFNKFEKSETLIIEDGYLRRLTNGKSEVINKDFKLKEIYISENNKRALCTKYGALFFIDGEDGICKYICENDFRGSILFLLNDGDEISECFRNMTFIGYDKNLNFLFIPLKTNQAVEIYDLKKIELIKSFNVLENYLEELEPECYIGFLISDREDYDLHIFYLACSSGKIECEFYYNINENHFIEIEQSKLKKKSDENANLVYELTLEEEKQIKIGQDLYDEQMLKNK